MTMMMVLSCCGCSLLAESLQMHADKGDHDGRGLARVADNFRRYPSVMGRCLVQPDLL